ncbi:ABC transporter permease [Brevibacillus humidisoli]|uniref:ABC transporter permease n=1 Tax=Brevibacillus humidisoli TaxID=2895522 RepID=UPI001E625587|nr:ABC transporter permease [Brevibacillus humidisoli]UFJ39266.1 ABC transporter permease [Brevibacillus humidisoli]
MKAFIIKRVLQIIPVMIGLSILIFTLSRIMPGDPVRLALGPEATQEQITKMREELGLNESLPVQYLHYMGGVLQGDLGISLRTNRNVMEDLVDKFPATLELTTVAMALSILLGVPLGVIAAVRKDKWEDHATRLVALSGVAIPRFWLGIMLQIVFAYWFSMLPTVGRGDIVPTTITGMRLFDSLITFNFPAFWDSLQHIILPAISLSLGTLAQIMRLTRSNMIDQVRKDYILASKAYGLPKRMVVYKYMLKNAFTSTLTIIGMTYGFLLGNAFLVEAVFSWPGMAQYGIQAVIYKDFNAIVGVTMVVGIAFAIGNLIVDILYGYLDPRIKYN